MANSTPTDRSSAIQRVFVAADDLSGALDVGAEFADRDLEILVCPRTPDWARLPRDAAVVVVNTVSRHLPPDRARRIVREAAETALQAGFTRVFKKTDSTLRGNVGAELEAVFDAVRPGSLCFAPAAPAHGRVTRGGMHFVQEVPLHLTDYARDPLEPLDSSDVATLLRRQTRLPCAHATSQTLSDPTAALASGIVIADAETEDDLATIANALARRRQDRCAAGAARFAYFLAEAWGLPKKNAPSPVPAGPLLIVNGSLNPRALRQIALVKNRYGFACATLSPEAVAVDGSLDRANAVVQSALERLAGSRHLILETVGNEHSTEDYLQSGAAAGVHPPELHAQIAERLAAIVEPLAASNRFAALLAIGGDTIQAIADRCGWTAFRPLRELAPGVVLSRAEGRVAIPVLSKPGGFGDEDALLRLARLFDSNST